MHLPTSRRLYAALFCFTIILCGGLTFKHSDTQGLLWFVNNGPSNNLKIDIHGFAPPNTNPKAQPDFDIFAWNSFIALNWPAIKPDSANGFLRGIPDVNKSFKTAKSTDLLVWETFKEKREIFNQTLPNDTTPTLYPWNFPVEYGPLRTPEQADGRDDDPDAPIIRHESYRGAAIFHQGRKMMTPFNSFDETAEVGSEALEQYYPNGDPSPIYRRPVGPRVWKGTPSDSIPVVYEVKLNYDYYNYIDSNKLYLAPTELTNQEADLAELRLPYRTSASAGPKGQQAGGKYHIATRYSKSATEAAYRKIKNGRTNPPFVGAMQFKAAWVELDSLKDNLKNYHTARALYYDSDEEGNPVPQQGIFGLIGLHIIQRIHVSQDSIADPTGGTFVFATWEHTSIRSNPQSTGYTYSNYYNPAVDPGPTLIIKGDTIKQGFYPPINTTQPNDGVYPVKALFDIISNPDTLALGTQQVNAMVHKMLPANSVWQNYQLVGTQYIAIDVHSSSTQKAAGKTPRYPISVNDPQGIGLPVYLANLVIETNHGLQKFQGQPPGTIPIDNYVGAGVGINSGPNFARQNNNTSFNRVAYNMGGCMGCHGVAQSKGFSFSFVLLGGRNGAATDTETIFEIPPLDSITSN